MTDKQSTVVVSDMIVKLRMAQCSSCSCLTKTNDPAYHKEMCLYRVLSEAITLLAATPEQAVDVGEPVAWQDPDMPERICTAEHKRYVTERGGPAEAALRRLTEPLYRHAQPPAKVVLPERKPSDCLNYNASLTADGWNACLAEVARLNGVKHE